MGRGKSSFAACALAAGALACAAPAVVAAPTWLDPAPLGAGAGAPDIATGSTGDTVAAWVQGGRVVAAVRPAGGGFAAAQILGAPESADPQVALADDGTAVAAWRQSGSVAYSIRPPGGGFGPATQIAAGGSPTAIALDVNRAGEAVLAFVRDQVFVTLRAPGGAFGPVTPLSDGAGCGLRADLADSGHGAVAWHGCGAGGGPIGVARRAPGAAFGPTATLPGAIALDTAVNEEGTTVVAFESTGAVRAAEAAAGGGFGEARRLSPTGDVADGPALAAGGSELWAAWRQGGPSGIVSAARRSGPGTFDSPQAVSQSGVAGAPRLEGGASGTFVLAWPRDHGDPGVLAEAAHRAPGAPAFGAPAIVSVGGADVTGPELAVDADGNGVVGFLRAEQMIARALDAAGPRLVGIDMRAAGFAQEAYRFAFDPVDAWTGVASTRIDFGDGTNVAARSAEHAYATQGDKILTFSATDTVGNAASHQRLFQAAPPFDRTAPVIRRPRLDAKRFRISGKATAVAAAVRRGTRFRYTLSEPAQATIFFERVRLGRRRSGGCHRGGRRGKRCRVYEPVGLITRTHPVAGRVSVGFSGRIVGYQGPLKIADIRLRPGRYRATIVAADINRNVSKPVQLAFTVLR